MSLVTVAKYDWRMQADLAQSRLEACGIESFVPDDEYSTLRWDQALAIGGIRLQVPEEEAEDALAVIRDLGGDVEPIESIVEQRVDRLMRTAAFCVVMPPVFGPYGLWLLYRLMSSGEALDAVQTRRAWIASVMIVGVVLLQLGGYLAFRFAR